LLAPRVCAAPRGAVWVGSGYARLRIVAWLAEVIEKRGRLDPPLVCAVAEKVAAHLDALHAEGLVHGDVTPASILVDEVGAVSITEFALAGDTQGGSLALSTAVRSLDYMAPERIRNEKLTPAADVYGLGCVTYECLCGAAPFAHRQGMGTLWAHLRDPPTNPSDLRRNLPAAASVVILRALEKDPAARAQSAGEFARQLRAACN
jgi:serine/threonine protein kinase